MLWHYSRRESKLLLLATLVLSSGYAFLLAHDWQAQSPHDVALSASAVSVAANVEQNKVNTLMAQLEQREQQLSQREAALTATYPERAASDQTLFLVTMVGIGLLGLILLNFYFDSKRRLSLS